MHVDKGHTKHKCYEQIANDDFEANLHIYSGLLSDSTSFRIFKKDSLSSAICTNKKHLFNQRNSRILCHGI